MDLADHFDGALILDAASRSTHLVVAPLLDAAV
jgi:hypothetical protein